MNEISNKVLWVVLGLVVVCIVALIYFNQDLFLQDDILAVMTLNHTGETYVEVGWPIRTTPKGNCVRVQYISLNNWTSPIKDSRPVYSCN